MTRQELGERIVHRLLVVYLLSVPVLVPLLHTWDSWIGIAWVRWSLVAACVGLGVVGMRWVWLLLTCQDTKANLDGESRNGFSRGDR